MAFGGLLLLGCRDSAAGIAKQLPNLDATKNIEEIVEQSENSVACFKGLNGGGTGFLIRSNVVVTNTHVIKDEFLEFVEITFPSAPEPERGPHKAKLLYINSERDIAFLEIQTSLPPLSLAFPHQFRRGKEIVIIGHPLELQNVVTTGVLSSQEEIDEQIHYQLSTSINPGNSGGPVMNRSGEVIGMVSFKHFVSDGRRVDGIAYCISINDVMASLLEMETLTDKEKDIQDSIHRASIAFGKLAKVHRNYVICMEWIAVASNRAADLDALMDSVADIIREHDLRDDETSEIRRVLLDENLSASLRKDLNAFFINCMDIKDYVDNPRELGEAYSAKLNELRNIGRRLQFELQLDLGIPDEE